MQNIKTFSELVSSYKTLPYPGRIFMEQRHESNFQDSQFWVLSSKEEKDENLIETEFGLIPESLVAYDVSEFLFVDTFQDIIDNLLENNPQFSIDDTDIIIKAINYYLENDDFMD